VLILDSLIIGSVRFVLNKLIEAVDAEMYDETSLREELLAAQMKLELGEITEEEFSSIEDVVLAGLREVGERKKAAAKAAAGEPEEEEGASPQGRKFKVESVSADFDHREEP
jgi:hypothetical protein